MTFDSISEGNFYTSNKALLTPFNDTYFDYASGKFKVDFKATNGIYIEFKDFCLNNSPNKEEADKRLYAAINNPFKKASVHYCNLLHAWNHSAYKIKEVQEVLQGNFLLVFSDSCKMSASDKANQNKALSQGKLTDARLKKLTKLGINWCYASDLEERLNPH